MTADTVDEKRPGVWVSIAELAKMNGVSKQAVSKRVKKFAAEGLLEVRSKGRERHVNAAVYGRLVKDTTDPAQHLRNADHTLSTGVVHSGADLAELDLALKTETDETLQSDTDPEDTSSRQLPRSTYNDAKAKKAAIDAEIAYLDYQQRIGNLVLKEEADAQLFETLRRVRDRMLGLPAMCADTLAAAPDARAIRASLTEMIRKALDEAAADLENDSTDDDGED